MILWGPAGTGKTTLARILANSAGYATESLSAVTSGVKDVREALVRARERLGEHSQRTVLFIDEVHRFNKSQQDLLLPATETGQVVLIGATTENPYFEVNAALMSRATLWRLHPLSGEDLEVLVRRGVALRESAITDDALEAIKKSGVDAVVGYTQRFRRRWLAAKEKVRTGQLGDVTMVTSRAFMNRLVALDNYKRTDDPTRISPMVISGTHALDIVMWMMEAKRPVEVYARSVDKALGPLCRGTDGTAGMITFEDGSMYHASISWALPVIWPGAVYSLDVGIVGTEGVLTIDDTHRDIVLATTLSQSEGYAPDANRRVDFLGSYPPGDMAFGELRGPMREETEQWLNRVSMGLPTQHATAAEAHNRLMLTKAFDLSARRKKPVALPITPQDEAA